MELGYEIKPVNGHYEVYVNGEFKCSADTMPEAVSELEKIMFNERNDS